jgi:hypothetical protein
MPISGSAPSKVFSRQINAFTGSDAWVQLENSGRFILSADQDTEGNDIASALNSMLMKDGGNFATDMDINSNKFTNVENASARTHFAAAGQVQDSSLVYVGAGGTGDAITLDLTPSITAYAAGQTFHFKASATNTGAATINVDAVGAKDIKKGAAGSTALAAGDITSGGMYTVQYDGTNMQLLNPGAVGTGEIANDAVTYAKLQNVSATSRILGRKTASAGDAEECTLSEVLDFIGSAAQGDILYRGAASWARLGAGTSGQFLKTQGTGANPTWATLPGIVQRVYTSATSLSTTAVIASDGSVPQSSEGGEVLSASITPTSATNRIRVTVTATFETNISAVASVVMALFNGAAGAVALASGYQTDNNQPINVFFVYEEVSGGTSAITYSARAGANSAGTLSLFNDYGATMPRAMMTIDEIVP